MTFEQTEKAREPFVIRYNAIINALLWLLFSFSSFTFIEPAPYDIILVVFIGVWLFSGFHIHRSSIPIIALSVFSILMSYFAIVPWFHMSESVTYWSHSVYLSISLIFYSALFGEDAEKRTQICLDGYVIACLLAAFLGIIGWFDVGGASEFLAFDSRAMGPFKDPNVFGSFLVPGYLYLFQRLLVGRAMGAFFTLFTVCELLVLLLGIFLSFSRGSWGAAILATFLMSVIVYMTSDAPAARRRLVVIFVVVIAIVAATLLAALSIERVRDIFVMRASLNQSYDLGETGRFGNQLRSIGMLIEMPFGMGPLRFRSFFGLDPHNSYVGSFANNGWIGGFLLLLTFGATTFVGARLCLLRSPFRRNAQVFAIPMLMFFLQGFQIDVDHWRFVYIMMGGVWGLEAARQRWLERRPLDDEASGAPNAALAGT